ncbi:MAG: hypothetical protein AAFO82_07810 [Bacteroidota bacterium]
MDFDELKRVIDEVSDKLDLPSKIASHALAIAKENASKENKFKGKRTIIELASLGIKLALAGTGLGVSMSKIPILVEAVVYPESAKSRWKKYADSIPQDTIDRITESDYSEVDLRDSFMDW